MKKQRPVGNKNSKPYWGALADSPFLRPNNFMSLLRAQYQNTRVPIKNKTKPTRTGDINIICNKNSFRESDWTHASQLSS